MKQPPMAQQISSWNEWNAQHREAKPLNDISESTSAYVLGRIDRLVSRTAGKKLKVLEVGSSTGWMSDRLSRFGDVTGVELPGPIVQRAQERFPHVRFIGEDFMSANLPPESFDVVSSLQTLPHISDQAAFAARVARILKPGGHLVLTCQNRFVFRRIEWVGAGDPRQVRLWPSPRDIRRIFSSHFTIEHLGTIHPAGSLGMLRIVNSPKLNRWAGAFVDSGRLERWKERAGFGQFIVVDAARGAPSQAV